MYSLNLALFVVRTSRSEFIVSLNKYLEARNHKLSVGMRFKMRFEGEEVPERRYLLYMAHYQHSWVLKKSRKLVMLLVDAGLVGP